ncbi:MAG: hypothetical protein ACM3UZ_01780 [Acidobacteriota bacterium]
MKIKHLTVLSLIFILISLVGCISTLDEMLGDKLNEEFIKQNKARTQKNDVKPNYIKPTRPFKKSDFNFLKPGMRYGVVVDRVGLPDRDYGSGLVIAHYNLIDAKEIILNFDMGNELWKAEIIDSDNTEHFLVTPPKE